MKPPTAAQKRCLLQAVEAPQASLGQERNVLHEALAVLKTIPAAAPTSGCRAPRGPSIGRTTGTPAASAWAALLVDLVRRGRDRLDEALATPGAADSDALRDVLQLSWALLDSLEAVRDGWKGDAFLAVRRCILAACGSGRRALWPTVTSAIPASTVMGLQYLLHRSIMYGNLHRKRWPWV